LVPKFGKRDLISFIDLKSWDVTKTLSPEARFRPIQEELAEFLMREVLHPKGEHYYEDEELLMP
jgi:hypothetical protein